MTLTKRGFTLVELLVVIAMIAMLIAAMTTSLSAAQQRARIQKATSDVKVISLADAPSLAAILSLAERSALAAL